MCKLQTEIAPSSLSVLTLSEAQRMIPYLLCASALL